MSYWTPLSVAHEIIYSAPAATDPTAPVPTYKGSGTNPITEDEWQTYVPPAGYIKNTERELQFNESHFIASPGEPDGTTAYITTSDSYTWAAMSKAASAMWPYSASDYDVPTTTAFEAGLAVTTPPDGVVKVSANYKGEEMKFYANENGVAPGTPGAVPLARFFVTDQWGNEYIMHASDYSDETDVATAFANAVLPEGWTKETRYLSSDFILQPAYMKGDNNINTYEYLLFRDSQDNTYHQTSWSESGYNLAAQIEDMPIWGGRTDDILRIDNSWDNTIYGGGGNDLFIFNITGGTSIIEDFSIAVQDRFGQKTLKDTLNFSGQSYTVHDTSAGMEIDLSGGGTVILSGIHLFSNSWVVSV